MTPRPRRFRWRCPSCDAYGSELTPAAARETGLGHYAAVHDVKLLSDARHGLARSVPLSPGPIAPGSSGLGRMYE